MIGILIDDEQGSSRAGRECADQIFILKQMGNHERKNVECMWVLYIWRKTTIGLIGNLCGKC